VPGARGITTSGILAIGLVALMIVGAILVARRNVRLERADHAGAMRVAIVLLLANVIWGLLLAHHVLAPVPMMVTLAVVLAGGTLVGSLAFIVYLALEPDLRRKSPQTLVSWSRVIAGGFRDPLVGRDLLVGAAAGVGLELLRQLQAISPSWLGRAPDLARPPNVFDGSVLRTLAYILGESVDAALVATSLLLMFVLFMVVLRRRTLATALFVLVGFVLTADQLTHWIQWPFEALLIAVVVAIVVRLGLLPLVVAEIVQTVLYDTPLVLDPGVWFAPASYTVLIFILALALFGLRTSLAGERVFARRFD
jgi:serine/threonine-protein kinase